MELVNETPFEVDRYGVADREGADLLVVVVKGTFTYDPYQKVRVAEEQLPIEVADRYYGKPEDSSVEYSSDFSIGKAGTDIALVGHAYPSQPGQTELDIGLQVGDIQKRIKVFGDRFWIENLGFPRMTPPLPFEKMPLTYERAFGGVDKSHPEEQYHEWEARNPVGVGFRARKSQKPIEGERLPNLEDPRNLIRKLDDRPDPIGLGFVGPAWQPRLSFAGTYDEAWEQTRMPLLPDDFNERFFNTAHPSLITAECLCGGEEVAAIGVMPYGAVRFDVPTVQLQCSATEKANGEQPVEIRIDKLVIEPDEQRFILVWSGHYTPASAFIDIESVNYRLTQPV